ncbi:MAG: hypothetical protein CMF96_01625 [Candidatus Marinimicrobia bacterium]|nr:hypothetical protein [Candidatus Neomarinimicrobiota bacterium]|tara:strand:+ start:26271 stop:27050 length:780 start_codon:yes stop_codon:yes gene_type:complete
MKRFVNISLVILFCISCGNKTDLLDENISEKFNLGMKYFEKEKYLKAESEFNFLILSNPGSKLALEAQYYMAESMFKQEKYEESIVEYDRYSRFSDDLKKIEHAGFRSCEASFLISNEYLHDQGASAELMDKLQIFIEKYPKSDFNLEIEVFFKEIRSRLAKKEYEAGRLYLKLEEYEAALIYFNDVISLYYDTKYADWARVEIIFTYLLQQNPEKAKSKLALYSNKFIKIKNYEIALKLIDEIQEGSLTLSSFIRLYK